MEEPSRKELKKNRQPLYFRVHSVRLSTMKLFTRKKDPETTEHKAVKRYRWEYRLRAVGVTPFDLKKISRVIPPILIGLSSWALPFVLASAGAGALVIAGSVIAAKLGAMTYVSLVIGKEFKEAHRQMHADIDDGSLLERYKRESGVKTPPLERFLENVAPENMMPGNDNKKGLFNFFSRKKTAQTCTVEKNPAAPKPPKAA